MISHIFCRWSRQIVAFFRPFWKFWQIQSERHNFIIWFLSSRSSTFCRKRQHCGSIQKNCWHFLTAFLLNIMTGRYTVCTPWRYRKMLRTNREEYTILVETFQWVSIFGSDAAEIWFPKVWGHLTRRIHYFHRLRNLPLQRARSFLQGCISEDMSDQGTISSVRRVLQLN